MQVVASVPSASGVPGEYCGMNTPFVHEMPPSRTGARLRYAVPTTFPLMQKGPRLAGAWISQGRLADVPAPDARSVPAIRPTYFACTQFSSHTTRLKSS